MNPLAIVFEAANMVEAEFTDANGNVNPNYYHSEGFKKLASVAFYLDMEGSL